MRKTPVISLTATTGLIEADDEGVSRGRATSCVLAHAVAGTRAILLGARQQKDLPTDSSGYFNRK